MRKLKKVTFVMFAAIIALLSSGSCAFSLTVAVSNCVPASSAFHRWDCNSVEDCIRTEEAVTTVNAGVLTTIRVSPNVPATNCTPTAQSEVYTTTIETSFTASYSVTSALEAGYAGVIKASVESEFGISATVTMGLSIGCNVNVPPNECYFVYLASQVMKNKKVTQAVSHKYTRTDTMTYGIGCECFTTCSSTTSVIASKDGDRVLTAPGCNWYVAPRPCCGE